MRFRLCALIATTFVAAVACKTLDSSAVKNDDPDDGIAAATGDANKDTQLFKQAPPPDTVGRHAIRSDWAGIKSPACQSFLDYTFPTTQRPEDMSSFGVMVIKDGKIALESYRQPENAGRVYKVFSISKTISGLMLGALMQKTQPASGFGLDTVIWPPGAAPDKTYANLAQTTPWPFAGDKVAGQRPRMQVENFWTMGSGLKWCEYEHCAAVDPLRLMYGAARADNFSYVVNKPVVAAPGTRYQYSAGNYAVLQKVINSAYRLHQVPGDSSKAVEELLFNRLGITNYGFERDGTGLLIGGSGAWLGLRDFAKLGVLMLNHGEWDGQPVVSRAFYDKMITTSAPILSPGTPATIKNWEGPHGGSIWLNRQARSPDGALLLPVFLPKAPASLVYAGGKYGQYLLIYPEQNLIVARLGEDLNHSQHWAPYAELAQKCFVPELVVQEQQQDVEIKKPEGAFLEQEMSVVSILIEQLLPHMVALETCNCLNLSGEEPLEQCRRRTPLPDFITNLIAFDVAKVGVDAKRIRVSARLNADNIRALVDKAQRDNLGFSSALLSELARQATSGVGLGAIDAVFDPARKHDGCRLAQPPAPSKYQAEIDAL